LLLLGAEAHGQLYRDSTATVEDRVQDLLSRMTPEEKFWQLFMIAGDFNGDESRYSEGLFGLQVSADTDGIDPVARANAVQRHFVEHTRLGIPIIFFAEALHGLVQSDAVVFPQAIGLAASFDISLMHDVACTAALECRNRGVRQVLSPVVNIASDVRWGRTEETYGEDPFLSAAMGVAFVSEFESHGIITTPKHFIANVGNGGRDSYPIHMSERLLKEVYLPPFEACILRGGSRSIMTSYNSFDGAPCSASDWLNNIVLKQGLDFKGFIISDAGAVGGANVLHFTAADYPDAGAKAISAGLDVIFQTSYDHYALFMPPFLDGRIDRAVIDLAVARVLRAKFQLGLFEHPYVDVDESHAVGSPEHRVLARRAAQESIVLLKNDDEALPFSGTGETIAVIGPDAAEVRFGGYSAPKGRLCSILEGIKEAVEPQTVVRYALGCRRLDTTYVTIPTECLSSRYHDSTVTGLIGEYFNNVSFSGPPAVSRVDCTVQFHWTLFSPDPEHLTNDFYAVRWTGALTAPVSGSYKLGVEGNDGYRLYVDDSLIIDRWTKASYHTTMTDFTLEAGRSYSLRLEYYEPTGTNSRIRLVWNVGVASDEENLIQEAVDLATECEQVVLVVGLEEGEFRDRASLALPGHQETLIRRVAELGKPTTVVIVGGSAVTMTNWLDDVPAVLCAWYPGEEGGRAVADVLFGEYNPAGRLPITYPISDGQLPLTYNHLPTGRGDNYYDLTGEPLFPFGYGLSYTSFEYDNLRLDTPQITAGESTQVRFTLKNIGAREGDEVVQLYIRDELASTAQPVMALKGFERIHLEPGETREVVFAITPDLLTVLDADVRPVVEPGDFRIMLGSSSKDIRLRGVLTVVE